VTTITIIAITTTQPEGWLDDEPEMVADPEAAEPEDWDEEEDGAWEAPMVFNPKVRCVQHMGCMCAWVGLDWIAGQQDCTSVLFRLPNSQSTHPPTLWLAG
jgi:hypothetical protein